MNNRQKELLKILLFKEKGASQIRELSEELDCAEKTVRNDLDVLEKYLQDYPDARLTRKPGFGISITIDPEIRSKIVSDLFSSEQKTNEERLMEIAYELLTSNKAITLQYLADRYFVPKAAIKKDLEIITTWFERFNIELISKPRLGSVVQGSELDKRNALAHLSKMIPYLDNEKNYVLDLFLPYEVSTVRKALVEMEKKFSMALTEDAVESLLVHALIMVKRTRQKSPVFVKESERESVSKKQEYQFALWLFAQLETTFRITFPKEERVYFTWHLISSKRIDERVNMTGQNNANPIVTNLIAKMSRLTLFDFEEDSILKNGLAVHFHSVLNRITYGFPITNPLLSNIKKMYPYMFNMAVLALEETKEIYSIEIPEDEIAYIVLHFQASIERMEGRKSDKKKALIVCHMGIGMSHLLEAKIEQQYQNIEVVACIGKSELSEFINTQKTDFIISTIPLDHVKVDHIVISPLFGQEDKKKLSKFIEEIIRNKRKSEENHVLSDFIHEDLLLIGIKKEHRYEVVEMLASRLASKGYVEKSFIHNAVNRERKSATAIGGGIAIPHGDPKLIRESAIAVAILEEPLEWGDEFVSIVFMLALSKDNKEDIKNVIGKIAVMSESPLLVQELIDSKNYQHFLQTLAKDNRE